MYLRKSQKDWDIQPTKMRRCIVPMALAIMAVLVAPTVKAQNANQCLLQSSSPRLISASTNFGGVVIDDQCQKLYVSNTSANTVDVYSVSSGTKLASIAVGSQPAGLDLSADGTQLFVANSGAQSISVVDVATNKETRKYIFAPNFMNDRPNSLAVARNGLVFFTTTFAGSGFGGRMMQLNPSSGAITQRTDFWFYGACTEATRISSNADHSLLAVAAGDISSGPVFEYSASTDTYTTERDLNTFVSSVALDSAGDFMLVNPGTYVLDGNRSQVGIVAGGSYGVAVDPSGTYGYAVSSASQINVLDLKRATQISTLAIGDTVASGNYYGLGPAIGQMTISRDGGLLAIISDHGLSLVPTGVVQVVPFATFSAHVSLDIHEDSNASLPNDAFLAEGHFTLGAASNGIDLVAHQLNFQIGSFSLSIPSGSFIASQGGLRFAGKVADYDVRAQITPEAKGGYGFALGVKGVNLAGSVLPLTLALTIGDNAGTFTMPTGNARFFGIDVTGRKED